MLINRYSFTRKERLKSEKSISELFESGYSLTIHPIRLIYRLKNPTTSVPVKIGFVVPKKNFKRAVDRNLLKRRMREAYRLNKSILQSETSTGFEIMLVYQGQEAVDYDKISATMILLLKKLALRSFK